MHKCNRPVESCSLGTKLTFMRSELAHTVFGFGGVEDEGEEGGGMKVRGWRMKGGGTVMNIVNDTEIWPHYWQYKMIDGEERLRPTEIMTLFVSSNTTASSLLL